MASYSRVLVKTCFQNPPPLKPPPKRSQARGFVPNQGSSSVAPTHIRRLGTARRKATNSALLGRRTARRQDNAKVGMPPELLCTNQRPSRFSHFLFGRAVPSMMIHHFVGDFFFFFFFFGHCLLARVSKIARAMLQLCYAEDFLANSCTVRSCMYSRLGKYAVTFLTHSPEKCSRQFSSFFLPSIFTAPRKCAFSGRPRNQ